jgi:hypothetical protein
MDLQLRDRLAPVPSLCSWVASKGIIGRCEVSSYCQVIPEDEAAPAG